MDASLSFGADSIAFDLDLSDVVTDAETSFDMAGRSNQYSGMTEDFENRFEEEQSYHHQVSGAIDGSYNVNSSGEFDFSPSLTFPGAEVGLDMVDGSNWNILGAHERHGEYRDHDEQEDVYPQQVTSANLDEGTSQIASFPSLMRCLDHYIAVHDPDGLRHHIRMFANHHQASITSIMTLLLCLTKRSPT